MSETVKSQKNLLNRGVICADYVIFAERESIAGRCPSTNIVASVSAISMGVILDCARVVCAGFPLSLRPHCFTNHLHRGAEHKQQDDDAKRVRRQLVP